MSIILRTWPSAVLLLLTKIRLAVPRSVSVHFTVTFRTISAQMVQRKRFAAALAELDVVLQPMQQNIINRLSHFFPAVVQFIIIYWQIKGTAK